MRKFWSRRERDDRSIELDDEIRAHFAMAVADRIARGESPEDATAAARREFGNVGHVKEVTRETWGGVWIDRLGQDVHYAIRSLRRSPAFTGAAVLTFALGIGVNTAMFTVVNAVLLRPLPFKNPENLYIVSHSPSNVMFVREPSMLDRQYSVYRDVARAFEATTSYNTFPATLVGAGDPTRLNTAAVTTGFFDVLGVRPAIGRPFAPAEHNSGTDLVVILSDAIWRDRFSSDRDVLGKSVILDGQRRTIVGVMPVGFDFPGNVRLWFPTEYRYDPSRIAMRPVLGRLAPGATVIQAKRELQAFVGQIEHDHPDDRIEHATTQIIPLRQRVVGDVQRSLLLFAGAVAFVLLIACANVANLLLMRVSARQHEIGIRAAIGAERPRLIRQLLTESLVLSFAGGIIGLGIALAGVRGLLSLAPPNLLPRTHEIHIDAIVLAVTALVCTIAGLAFGIVPALQVTRRDLRTSLNAGRGLTGGGRSRLRNVLVMAECTLAVVLLVGSGLLMRSFLRLRGVDVGFRTDNIVTFTVDLPDDRYATNASMQEFRTRMTDALARVPGTTSVAVVNWRPLSESTIMGDFVLEGGRKLPQGYVVLKPAVTPDYFRAMGIGVRAGRAFLASDDDRAPGVVVVSRLVAERLWPNGDAIGKQISMEDNPKDGDWLTVVGIVDDIVQFGMKEQPSPAVYQPLAQLNRKFMLNHLNFMMRVESDPTRAEQAVRGALRTVDPLQPVQSITTMQAIIAQSIAEPLFQTRLLGLFAGLAVVLAAVGIYGVLAYAVAERTQEIGIRVALGATPDRVAMLIVRRTLLIAIPGIVVGLFAASWITRFMSKLLYEVSPTDPATFTVVAVLLGLVAIVASATPARRASRVDPMVALRME